MALSSAEDNSAGGVMLSQYARIDGAGNAGNSLVEGEPDLVRGNE
jgi:hypothetical protein